MQSPWPGVHYLEIKAILFSGLGADCRFQSVHEAHMLEGKTWSCGAAITRHRACDILIQGRNELSPSCMLLEVRAAARSMLEQLLRATEVIHECRGTYVDTYVFGQWSWQVSSSASVILKNRYNRELGKQVYYVRTSMNTGSGFCHADFYDKFSSSPFFSLIQ